MHFHATTLSSATLLGLFVAACSAGIDEEPGHSEQGAVQVNSDDDCDSNTKGGCQPNSDNGPNTASCQQQTLYTDACHGPRELAALAKAECASKNLTATHLDFTDGGACSSNVNGPLDSFDQVSFCCDPSSPSNPCATCLLSQCAVEIASCEANPECAAIQACALGCADWSCTAKCYDAHPKGQNDWKQLDFCGKSHCSVECGA